MQSRVCRMRISFVTILEHISRRSSVAFLLCAAFLLYLFPTQSHPPTMTFPVRTPLAALRQQGVVNLGNIAYYLRNRIEVSLVVCLPWDRCRAGPNSRVT